MIVLKGRSQRIEVVAFAPSGGELISAGNDSWLDRWFIGESEPDRLFEAPGPYSAVTDAAYIDGGRAVLAACGAAGLRVYRLSATAKLLPGTYPGLGSLQSLTVAGDGARVVGFNVVYPLLQQPEAQGYNCWVADEGGGYRAAWSAAVPSWCRGMAFLPGESRFAACELTRFVTRLVVREGAGGEIAAAYPCPELFVDQLTVSPDGRQLIARSGTGLLIWRMDDLGAPPRKVLNDNPKHFTGMAFHPTGRYLAATSNDRTVKLYDTATWQVVKAFTWDVGRLRSVAFSPDGLLAAAGSDRGRIVLWDVDV